MATAGEELGMEVLGAAADVCRERCVPLKRLLEQAGRALDNGEWTNSELARSSLTAMVQSCPKAVALGALDESEAKAAALGTKTIPVINYQRGEATPCVLNTTMGIHGVLAADDEFFDPYDGMADDDF